MIKRLAFGTYHRSQVLDVCVIFDGAGTDWATKAQSIRFRDIFICDFDKLAVFHLFL
jgi:hypothetical protein